MVILKLDDVNVGGAITATTFTGNLAGTVNTAAQPNITSLGTLTGLDVNGHSELDDVNVSGVSTLGNVKITGGVITAQTISLDDANITMFGATGNISANGNINANGNIVGDSATNISGINSVTATSFFGDGSGLENTGATLSAASGSQRLVLTSLTSGTMTSAATDADLSFNATSNY